MAITPGNYEDLHGGLTERLTEFGFEATRTVKVPWADRITIANQLVGTYSFTGSTAALTYPAMPSASATEVSIKGEGRISGGNCSSIDSIPTYQYAILTIKYSTEAIDGPDLPEVPEGTKLTYRSNLSGKFQTLPGRQMEWEDDDTIKVPEDVVGAIFIPQTEHVLTWSKVPAPPWAAMREKRGKVSAGIFLGAGAETVLYEGARSRAQFQIDDDEPILWELTYIFQERGTFKEGDPANPLDFGEWYGWNHSYRENPAGWERLKTNDGEARYQLTNFDDLFALA